MSRYLDIGYLDRFLAVELRGRVNGVRVTCWQPSRDHLEVVVVRPDYDDPITTLSVSLADGAPTEVVAPRVFERVMARLRALGITRPEISREQFEREFPPSGLAPPVMCREEFEAEFPEEVT